MLSSHLKFDRKTWKNLAAMIFLSSIFLIYLRCTASTPQKAKTTAFKFSTSGLWLCLHPESQITPLTWQQKSPYRVRLKHPKKPSFCLQTRFLGFRQLSKGRQSPCFEIKDKALNGIDDLMYLAQQKDTKLEVVDHAQRYCRPHQERITYGL